MISHTLLPARGKVDKVSPDDGDKNVTTEEKEAAVSASFMMKEIEKVLTGKYVYLAHFRLSPAVGLSFSPERLPASRNHVFP
jgi:hypothetical protein